MPKLSDLKHLAKDKEKEKPKKFYTAEEYLKIEKERKSIQPKKELIKEKIKKTPKKIDFNGIPGEVVNYRVNSEHSPTIIKVMNAYEDIAGVSAKRDKSGQTSRLDKRFFLKSLIYVSIHKLHQLENGEIR